MQKKRHKDLRLGRLIWGCFALLKLSALSAQEIPPLTNWVYTELKAQHQNWMMTQGKNHHMYFANSNGLLDFDGRDWKDYSLPQKQIVRAVGIDSQGNIFAGGYGEFGYWHPDQRGQSVYTSLSSQLSPERISSEEIWNLQLGNSWVIFQSFATLFFYNYDSLQIISPPGGGSISFIHQADGRFFLLQKGEILQELLIRADGIDFREVGRSPQLKNKNLVGMLPLSANQWLFCTARHGIFQGDGQQLKPWPHDYRGKFAAHELNRVLRLSNGDLAFGTILNGLYLTDSLGRARFHLNQSKGLQNNTILSLFEDKRKHLWMGLDNGVDMIDMNASLRMYRDLGGELGAIYAAARFEGKLYLGSNHGLFCKNEGKDPGFSLIPGTQGQVWDLKKVAGGLIIGHNNGTFLLNKKGLNKITDQSGGWCSVDLPGEQGQFLQGTYGGLLRYEKNTSDPRVLPNRIEGFSSSVKQLYIDEKEWVWAVNPFRGLHKIQLDQEKERVENIRKIGKDDGLPLDFYLRLMGNKAANILKADESFFLLEDGSIHPISQLGSIELDENLRHLWIGSQRDTFLIYPDRIDFRGAESQSSFPLRLIPNYEKIELLSQDEYLFCLETGYAIFRPDKQQENLRPLPPLQITEMIALQENSKVIQGLTQGHHPQKIKLKPSQKHLRFNFALPHYEDQVRFRYRLLGFNDPWSAWGTANFKEYTNLSPGSYRLELEEEQFGQQSSLEFYLPPPWYLSGAAMLMYLLLGLGVVFAAYQLHRYLLSIHRRRTAIEKEREFQQKIIRERNRQLEQDIQNKSRELANSTMGLIRKNETLMEMKQELESLYKRSGKQLVGGAYQKLRRKIDHSLSDEKDWQVFETHFTQVHQEFFQKLKSTYPDLTAGDLRLAAFLRMGLSSKEIAPLFNISLRGIENKRYRLRKKMELHKEENLMDVLMKY